MDDRRERLLLGAILATVLAVRLVGLDQPIVENYVGRQVPTAMVARNLDRSGGFLRPQLDTGPFPNLFLVEPPVFAAAASGLHRAARLPLEASGRVVSALGIALAAWGLFGLSRPREGPASSLLAIAAFGLFPVVLRYGRAFQPDAPALGLVLAGIRLLDEAFARGGRLRFATGWTLAAVGIAMKALFAFALLTTLLIASQPRPHDQPRSGRVRLLAVASLLLLAPLWYLHAASLLRTGSRASADNAAIWVGSLGPRSLWDPALLGLAARYVVVRSFTPIGFLLATAAFATGIVSRFWVAWLLSAVAMLIAVGAKAHHEYYWITLAPAAAIGVGRALAWLGTRGNLGRSIAIAAGLAFAASALIQSASTWRTPSEWATLARAGDAIRRHVPEGAWVVAPEAVLYAGDRRGCRLEKDRPAVLRAAGEWGWDLPPGADAAVDLVELYRAAGASFFADVGDPARGRLRGELHEAILGRYHPVLVDEPGFLLVQLNEPPNGVARRAPRQPARLRPLEGRETADQRADGL